MFNAGIFKRGLSDSMRIGRIPAEYSESAQGGRPDGYLSIVFS